MNEQEFAGQFKYGERRLMPVLGIAGILGGFLQLFLARPYGPGFALGGVALLMPGILAAAFYRLFRVVRQKPAPAAISPGASQTIFDQASPETVDAEAAIRRVLLIGAPLTLGAAGIAAGIWIAVLVRNLPASGGYYAPGALLGAEFLVLLALGRYFDFRGAPLLRPLGILCGGGSRFALAGLLAVAARALGWKWTDYAFGGAGALLAFLIGLEYMLRAAVRMPVADAERFARHLESGTARLFAAPSATGGFLAGLLDYQFGYAFSRTWLFQFGARAIAPFVLLVALILYGLSCMVVIAPSEAGIIERLGAPLSRGSRLDSGLHWKLPWPIETVRRFPALRLHSIAIGFVPGDTAPGGRPALWNIPRHTRSDYFLTPCDPPEDSNSIGNVRGGVPANLAVMNLRLEYIITNLAQYAYDYADPRSALEQTAWRALTRRAARTDLFDILTVGRESVSRDLHRDIQAAADRLGLGIAVMAVVTHEMQPPPEVAHDFHAVNAARVQERTLILSGEAWASRELPLAAARADAVLSAAQSYRLRRTAVAAAQAARFKSQSAAYAASPVVYKTRHKLRALAEGLKSARTYLALDAAAREVLQLNLEEKATPDLWDLSLPPEQSE